MSPFDALPQVLGAGHKIDKFESCDFDPIRAHLKVSFVHMQIAALVASLSTRHHASQLDLTVGCAFTTSTSVQAKTEAKKAASKEEKDRSKDEKTVLQMRYGFAVVDGHIEKMGNYNVEPPGLFRGRGEHPKMGQLKKVRLRVPNRIIMCCLPIVRRILRYPNVPAPLIIACVAACGP